MKNPVTTDNSMGNRLKDFLEAKYPNESHASRSRKFGFSNTTVLGWENGRAMPEEAYRRLIELGCDLHWLIAGAVREKAPAAVAGADEEWRQTFVKLCASRGGLVAALFDLDREVAEGSVDLAAAYDHVMHAVTAFAESRVAADRDTVARTSRIPPTADTREYDNLNKHDTNTA